MEQEDGATPAKDGVVRRVRTPMFERELMSAGADIVSSFTVGVFRDEQALVDACLYIGRLEYWGMEDDIKVALYKLNGTMAIGGRARKEAIQAHGLLYWPEDGDKDDKKHLAALQLKHRVDDNHEGEERRDFR